MANPVLEIIPEEARKGATGVFATGRSAYPNQINNVLVFPGIFHGPLDARVSDVTEKIKMALAEAIASIARRNCLYCLCKNIKGCKRIKATCRENVFMVAREGS